MKKALLWLLGAMLLLSAGCGRRAVAYQKYSYEFLHTFDTVIQIIGYARSQAEFDDWTEMAEVRFVELNGLYDMYREHDGVNNVKTINDNAGNQPVSVAPEIIELIEFSRQWQAQSPAAVNIAMGAPLALWHEYRERGIDDPANAVLPPMEELRKAAGHTDMDRVIVNREGGTVFLEDPGMRLDVGSIAKGFATELVAQELIAAGWQSFLINSGGNVRSAGKPLDGVREKWGVGIADPDEPGTAAQAGKLLDTAFVAGLSVTTAGDYQRFYTVSGKRYHHIIDPATLMPAVRFRAVTVVAESSAVADFVDTVLFILPYEQGLAYVTSLANVEALWVLPDGSLAATAGMKEKLKTMGGASSK